MLMDRLQRKIFGFVAGRVAGKWFEKWPKKILGGYGFRVHIHLFSSRRMSLLL